MCVALLALDAVIHTEGENGARKIPFEEFHLLPGSTPEKETILRPGELIVGVELPAAKFGKNVHYLKVRDRNSFSFALVSVAACLELDGKIIKDARIVLGGVATKPWRLRECEKSIVGKPVDKEVFVAAARAGVAGAKPLKYNQFKVELTRRSIVRALELAAGGLS
jgi:xanthine dehydrogenase YagS FAD-binding subunit